MNNHNTMTPTEAFAFRLKHEHEIKAVLAMVIAPIALTTVAVIILSPILLPLWLVEKVIKAVRK